MTRSHLLTVGFLAAAVAVALTGAGPASAQQKPVFTAPMVHPLGDSESAMARNEAPVRPVDKRPVPVGKTPRAHADEMAGVFQRACLDGRGDPGAAADWALNHGFVAAPEDKAQAAEKVDASSNVFAREADARSVLLMSSAYPFKCAVMARRAVDGARLREHLGRMASAWVGSRSPQNPVVDMRMLQGEPLKAARMVGYKFSAGNQVHTLMIAAPEKAGDGAAFITLMVSDAAAETAPPAASAPAASDTAR